VSRPALSALRALEIIDLMAGQPSQGFTLSDIVRMTGTNVASCHAILSVLQQRGYLLRHAVHRTYRLAPSIVAIGEAAAAHDPLLASAREAAARIAGRTGLETLLTARAGADIIGVARFPGPRATGASLRVGQRVPLRAPIGGLFFAWADEEEAQKWILSDGDTTPKPARAAHVAALALLRDRGFLVSLHTAEHNLFTRILAERGPDNVRDQRLGTLLAALDNGLYQPERIDPVCDYEVRVISAPIFDVLDQVLYTIGISLPKVPISGQEIMNQAAMLTDECASVVFDNGVERSAHA
jgi:DNA-binding IclR family transcriptional regulator